MARETKQNTEKSKNIAIHLDMWQKQQNSERKPGLPPARSPEITQGKPHEHKRLHVWNILKD